jgi:4-diphosphocytidyl-2-C-methyl-D-erythritol kinase
MATRVRSHSKINLGLAIGPVRADGFHGLATLYQTLAVYDWVTVEARRLESGSRSRIALTTNHAQVPADARNTAWKMVQRALARMGVAAEVTVHIQKELPVEGGMGAGSANAAAALLGLERELGCALPEPARLELAAEVGSDVPLFLIGGAVLGLGRGEQVHAMKDLPQPPASSPSPESASPPPGPSATGTSARLPPTPRAPHALGVPELTSDPQPDRLEELSLAYASVLGSGIGEQMESAPDTSGIVRGAFESSPGNQQVDSRQVSSADTERSGREFRFSRLSAPGSKTTSNRSSFLSIPSCVKSSTN